jgi:hypothetical protein
MQGLQNRVADGKNHAAVWQNENISVYFYRVGKNFNTDQAAPSHSRTMEDSAGM